MFKCIEIIGSSYTNKTNLFNYHYKITDSEFTSISTIKVKRAALGAPAMIAHALIKEYEIRNYDIQEIIKNLFLLNIFMLKENWYNNINQILEYQKKYLIKEYIPESNFDVYYNDLVKYTKKIMVLT